jgi:hypothetical protein
MNRIESIRKEIREIGPVLPGSLETFYNVCGKPGCRCKDKQNPQKHGPYYRLSYSLAGRNSSIFVKNDDFDKVKELVENYRKLRELTLELALANLDSVKQVGITETLKLSQHVSDLTPKADWKSKCRQKSDLLRAAMVKIRDLTSSRDKWRQECLQLRSETNTLNAKHPDVENSEPSAVTKKK